jgi:tRNA(Ile)-lysidine synthetase-like protein
LHLARRAPDEPGAAAADAAIPIDTGRALEWHGWRIVLGMGSDGLAHRASFAAPAAGRLAVRARRPGDRVLLRPSLAGGTTPRKKLQDVFVDAKVPLRLRDTWPVVTLDGGVVWVPGLTPPPSRGEVVLAAGRVGDGTTTGEDFPGSYSRVRQVASNTDARLRGGKRGRP